MKRRFIFITVGICLLLAAGCSGDEDLEAKNRDLENRLESARAKNVRLAEDLRRTTEHNSDLLGKANELRGAFSDSQRSRLLTLTELEETRQRLEASLSSGLEREEQWNELKEAFATLQQAHESSTAALGALTRDRDAAHAEVESLRARLDEARSEKRDGIAHANRYLVENRQLEQQIADLLAKEKEHLELVASLTRDLEQAKLLIRGFPDRGPVVPPPAIDAVVTGVSSQVNLVLLSVGRDDGVLEGMEFTVYRGGEYVGKVVVEKVEKDFCSGHSKKDIEAKPIVVGDSATTRF